MANLRIRENGATVHLSPKKSVPTLGLAVGHVVLLSSKKKVRGINAGAIVTVMTTLQAIRDRTMQFLPRKSVGDYGPTLRWGEHSIAHLILAALIFPAGIRPTRLINAIPESFGDGESTLGWHGTDPSCVMPGTVSAVARPLFDVVNFSTAIPRS